jgi:tetratricopeptide (TPR) repeat protein
LGRAYLGLGQLVKAEAALKQAVEINPYSPSAYNNLGRVYEAQRRFEEAEKAFRKQIEINPLDEWSHKNLGDLLLQRKKYAEAEPELEKAVAITPRDEQLYVNLGKAQINLNKTKEAQESFDRAVELAPTPRVWNEIAYTLAEHKTSLDRAREFAESAVAAVAVQLRNVRLEDLKPQHLGLVSLLGTFWSTLGWVEFKKGNMPSAEKYLVAAWQLTQKSIVADHLGQAYERMGKREQAIEYYAFAASVPRPEPDGRAHLAALVGEAKVESTVYKERERPANLRSYAVPGAKGEGSGEFFVMLAPASRVEEVRFVSGNEKLKPLANALRRVDFKLDFPDKTDTRVIRRGILVCSPSSSDQVPAPGRAAEKDGSVRPAEKSSAGSCDFILILPQDVHSVN